MWVVLSEREFQVLFFSIGIQGRKKLLQSLVQEEAHRALHREGDGERIWEREQSALQCLNPLTLGTCSITIPCQVSHGDQVFHFKT